MRSKRCYMLEVLYTPNCWWRNQGTSISWDRELNAMLDNPKFEHSEYPSDCTVVLNGVEIWVENYPYSYGNKTSDSKRTKKILPKRSTTFRLRDAYKEWRKNPKGLYMNRNGANLK